VVAFCFECAGATPKVTQVGLVIRNGSGAIIVAYAPTALPYSTVLSMRILTVPRGAPYPVGAYTAEALVDGLAAARTSFTVGTPSTTTIQRILSARDRARSD